MQIDVLFPQSHINRKPRIDSVLCSYFSPPIKSTVCSGDDILNQSLVSFYRSPLEGIVMASVAEF